MNGPEPTWLPEVLSLSPWKESTYNILYNLFQVDLIRSRPVYRGNKILVPREIEDGKERIFWHLTARKDLKSGERLPDLRRSERLLWIKPILENSGQPEVLDWDNNEGKKVKTYVWLKEYDFIVILKKLKNDRRLLITAYYIEYENTRQKFLKKFGDRI